MLRVFQIIKQNDPTPKIAFVCLLERHIWIDGFTGNGLLVLGQIDWTGSKIAAEFETVKIGTQPILTVETLFVLLLSHKKSRNVHTFSYTTKIQTIHRRRERSHQVAAADFNHGGFKRAFYFIAKLLYTDKERETRRQTFKTGTGCIFLTCMMYYSCLANSYNWTDLTLK